MNSRSKLRLFPLSIVPSAITLGNAVCGFAAVSLMIGAGPGTISTERLSQAGLLIIAAMILDAIDGGVARLLKQTSQFGTELDSLCDLISFGVAPALMVLHFSEGLPTRIVWGISLTYLLCVIVRLARFNVEADRENHGQGWFIGLPSPAAAGLIASLLMAWPALERMSNMTADSYVQATALWIFKIGPPLFPWLTLGLAFLMVSRIRYAHLVRQLHQGNRVKPHVLQLYVAVLALLTLPELSLPILFLAYIVEGPLRAIAWVAAPIIVRQIRPVLR